MKEIMLTRRIDCIQIPYNVARTADQQEMLDLATKLDLGVIIMEPLGAGSLVRMNVPDEELQPFRAFGCETWAQVLLKYIVSDLRVHVAIPATSSVERMKQNAAAGEQELFSDELRRHAERIYARYA
jgi:aryl-alcohol dehydrogenase-like predicted oxidoreductase